MGYFTKQLAGLFQKTISLKKKKKKKKERERKRGRERDRNDAQEQITFK